MLTNRHTSTMTSYMIFTAFVDQAVEALCDQKGHVPSGFDVPNWDEFGKATVQETEATWTGVVAATLMYSGSDRYRLGTDWVQIGSDRYISVQIGSDWYRSVQIGTDWFRLVLNGRFRTIQYRQTTPHMVKTPGPAAFPMSNGSGRLHCQVWRAQHGLLRAGRVAARWCVRQLCPAASKALQGKISHRRQHAFHLRCGQC